MIYSLGRQNQYCWVRLFVPSPEKDKVEEKIKFCLKLKEFFKSLRDRLAETKLKNRVSLYFFIKSILESLTFSSRIPVSVENHLFENNLCQLSNIFIITFHHFNEFCIGRLLGWWIRTPSRDLWKWVCRFKSILCHVINVSKIL